MEILMEETGFEAVEKLNQQMIYFINMYLINLMVCFNKNMGYQVILFSQIGPEVHA